MLEKTDVQLDHIHPKEADARLRLAAAEGGAEGSRCGACEEVGCADLAFEDHCGGQGHGWLQST